MAANKSKRGRRARPTINKKEAYSLLHDAQGRIDEGVGLVATIHLAFQAVQSDEGRAAAAEVEDQIAALGISVKFLRHAYMKLSAAIVGVTP
jgi:hypothetical protein